MALRPHAERVRQKRNGKLRSHFYKRWTPLPNGHINKVYEFFFGILFQADGFSEHTVSVRFNTLSVFLWKLLILNTFKKIS